SKTRSTPATLIFSGPVASGLSSFFAVAIRDAPFPVTSVMLLEADGRYQTGRTNAPVPEPRRGSAGAEPLDAGRGLCGGAGACHRRRRSLGARRRSPSFPAGGRLACTAPHAPAARC